MEARDGHQRGGLAAAGRSEEGDEMPLGDRKRDVVDRAVAAKVFHQPLRLQVRARGSGGLHFVIPPDWRDVGWAKSRHRSIRLASASRTILPTGTDRAVLPRG